MTQEQRREYLIGALLNERGETAELPQDERAQRRLLRALFNVRGPKPIDAEFLRVQDEYLQEVIREKGVTRLCDLTPVQGDLYLWQGDITTLECDGIVNAANSQMLGCFCPNHGCIDNAIHTYAGVQLRAECNELMRAQGRPERVGTAKITKAYNLPCKYVLHTVGPVAYGGLNAEIESALASCYTACLRLADEHGLKSIAFCCVSTGEFGFPNARAAEIAVATVNEYKAKTLSAIKVIFNVFKDLDRNIYEGVMRNS